MNVFRWVILVLALSACGEKSPVQSAMYVPVEPPQAVEAPAGRIEVLEFFFYGCIHCYRLHAPAKAWAGAQPADVVFRRVPVTFDRPQLLPMAKLFYALDATGQLAAHDTAVFVAIHEQNRNLTTDEAVLGWVGERGVDLPAFRAAYESPEVQAKVARAVELTRAYKVTGTPSLYVAGRYGINNEAATGYDNLMELTGRLVDKLRRGEKP